MQNHMIAIELSSESLKWLTFYGAKIVRMASAQFLFLRDGNLFMFNELKSKKLRWRPKIHLKNQCQQKKTRERKRSFCFKLIEINKIDVRTFYNKYLRMAGTLI